MTGKRQLSLVKMQAGRSGRVVQIQGGYGAVERLSMLGIRPGKKLTKISSMLMRGPVTIKVGTAQVAIGFGMASRVIVELDQDH